MESHLSKVRHLIYVLAYFCCNFVQFRSDRSVDHQEEEGASKQLQEDSRHTFCYVQLKFGKSPSVWCRKERTETTPLITQ